MQKVAQSCFVNLQKGARNCKIIKTKCKIARKLAEIAKQNLQTCKIKIAKTQDFSAKFAIFFVQEKNRPINNLPEEPSIFKALQTLQINRQW